MGLVIASIVLGFFSNHFGRRQGFFAASLLAYVGVTIQILVTLHWPIYIGRLIMGKRSTTTGCPQADFKHDRNLERPVYELFSTLYNRVLDCLVCEWSSLSGLSLQLILSQRGSLVSLFQPFTSLGTLVGALVSNALHKNMEKISYQAQLITLYAVPTWILVICFLVPESPRWLLLKGSNPLSSDV